MRKIILSKEDDLAAFCSKYKEFAVALINATKNTYGFWSRIPSYLLLASADRLAKKWLRSCDNLYYAEIVKIAKELKLSGVYALNVSYEWGCSSGGFATTKAPTMLRVLDWPFLGLGETLSVVQQQTEAGSYYNVTWPAFVGMFQGLAPGRFAAAINQAPMRRHGYTYVGDWLKNRSLFFKQRFLPPAHLLRQVFATASNYAEAKQSLTITPICIPAVFTLTGLKPQEACIIERLETAAHVRELASDEKVGVSNHFQSTFAREGVWSSRGIDSEGRAEQLQQITTECFAKKDFSWLKYPIINNLTRLCMHANAGSGELMLQGFDSSGPVTEVLRT